MIYASDIQYKQGEGSIDIITEVVHKETGLWRLVSVDVNLSCKYEGKARAWCSWQHDWLGTTDAQALGMLDIGPL